MKTSLIIKICLISFILIPAAIFTVMILGCSKQESDNTTIANEHRNVSNDYEAVPVKITRVRKTDIELFLVNNCTLEPEKHVDVVAKTAGIVKKIVVEEGFYVKTGDTLAELDDEESRLALSEARIKKENAERIYRRSLENFKDNIISREEYEERKFQYESAQIDFEKKQLEHKYTTIKSPIDGVVTNRYIDNGYNVEEDQIVFKIADFDPILAIIYVPEKDLNKIEQGQKARIVSEFSPDIELVGSVKIISPVVDPESGTVKVTIEISGLTRGVLMPGMFVSVHIVVGLHQEALVIPKNTLILEAEADEVFIVRYFIKIMVNSSELQDLNIDDTAICNLNISTKDISLNKGDYTVSGKIKDISRVYDSKVPSTITIEVNDIIHKEASNVFGKVSFYDNQNTLTLQIQDVAFSVETRAFKTKIALGFKEGDNVEVLKGLKEDDSVITVGQDDVGHGSHVTIVN